MTIKVNLVSPSTSEMFNVHFSTKQMLFDRNLKDEIQTHILLILRSISFNKYTKQVQQTDDELYQWKLQRRTVYKVTQKIQHSAATVIISQFSNQMKWEPTSVAAARVSIQKQSQINWVLEKTIKQCCEKKLCIHCGVSEHFKSNCLYYSVQWPITFTIIANTTTTVPETIICESDVMKVNDLKKE